MPSSFEIMREFIKMVQNLPPVTPAVLDMAERPEKSPPFAKGARGDFQSHRQWTMGRPGTGERKYGMRVPLRLPM